MAFIKWRGRWYSFSVAWQLILLSAMLGVILLIELLQAFK